MPVTQDYKNEVTGKVEHVVYWVYYYQLRWGKTLYIEQQAAYCSRCKVFVPAESIPSVADLKKRILKIKTDIPLRFKLDKTLRPKIAELKRRIFWRKKRKSPPRCQYCCGTDITPLPEIEHFPHPASGEMITRGGGALTLFEENEMRLFTPEGLLIRKLNYQEFESIRKRTVDRY